MQMINNGKYNTAKVFTDNIDSETISQVIELLNQHFGRTPQFKVYEISDGKVVSSEVIDTNGTGHGALAGFLENMGAKVLICGGIGGGALAAMNEAGIQLFAGASGNADEAVNSYMAGTLSPVGEATCDHHDHEHHEGHECAHGGKCHG